MLADFFVVDPNPSLIINGSYDYGLVFLSVVTTMFTAYLATYLLDLAKETPFKQYRKVANLTSALVLSGGVWSMHFIGMLAFSLCTTISYDPLITSLSFLPAFGAFIFALSVLPKKGHTKKQILLGAVLLGAGIGTMHYSGMAGMELSPMLSYDPFLFALSIIVAVALSYIALYVRIYLLSYFPKLTTTQCRFIYSIVFGFAVSGMHYMGMFATRFVATSPYIKEGTVDSDLTLVAISVAVTTAFLTIIVAIINSIIRYRILFDEKSKSESRMEAILSTAIDGIITIDHKGLILSFNNAAENIFGYQRDEVLGKNVKLLMADEIAEHHDGYLAKATNVNFDKVIGVNREVHAQHKNGTLFPIRLGVGEVIQMNKEPLYVGFITDLTEQKALQKNLVAQEQQYRSLITNMPGVAFRCEYSKQWPMIYISPSIKELTGYADSDFLTKKVAFGDLIIEEHQDRAMAAVTQALVYKTQYSLEFPIINKSGEVVWILNQGSFTFDKAGNTSWIDGVLLDITERRQYEDKLKEAKVIAEEAAKTKQEFLSNMSHEIRTPMNSIIGFSDLLMETSLDETQQKHISTVNHAARSLLHLLNEILDSAKLEKGKLIIEPIHFNLSTLLDNTISTLWLEAKNKGIELSLRLENIDQFTYFADSSRLRQILMNLIGNAIKFTEQGSIDVIVSSEENNHLKFEVIDTGIGIPQNRLKAVFEAFEQADGTVTRRFGGTGLGTSISKQLVELMGGNIGVISEEGKGSCFYFSLPMAKGDDKQIQSSIIIASQIPALSILVVDDIEQNVELLSILLEKDQHTVTTAANGLEAIAAYNESLEAGNIFDVILMDIHMPECDGIDASLKIRKIEEEQGVQQTPIVALTASVLEQDKVTARKAGMNGFANKPVDMAQLNKEIMRVLDINVVPETSIKPTEDTVQNIDYKKGEILWGSKEKHIQEVIRFLIDHKASFQRIVLLGVEPSDESAHILHTLKGLAGNLALTKLMSIVILLEKGITTELINDFKNEVDLLAKLTAKEPQPLLNTNDSKQQELSLEELKLHCAQLFTDANNAELNDALLTQLNESAPYEYQTNVNMLISQFEEFDFDGAIGTLTELIKQLESDK
ncbi:MHYT domain-containing protein [Colwellia sp. E2M01]|uniref:MHYT domain-containing protein n=1 Tax=Colwellia sp. E2M01 TaxID=2841561 RepID=UPI001C0A21FD|nr:MHYT domain-containing protein [Colwellia sp. E2M01]MBU2870187.1 PAS domain S-box protein [Colwellia sp. E2M01]